MKSRTVNAALSSFILPPSALLFTPCFLLHSGHLLIWNGKPAVRVSRERDELRVFAQREEDEINARFHHLFGAHRLIALVLVEMTLEQRESLLFLTCLRVDAREIIRGRKQGHILVRNP